MKTRKTLLSAVLGLAMAGLISAVPAATAQTADSCPPVGPPADRPGGTGQPADRPPYPLPAECRAAVSSSTVAPGGQVRFVATGFKPHSDVTLILRSDPIVLGTFKADANGVVDVLVTLPTNVAPGGHSLTASGVDPSGRPREVVASIEVPGTGKTWVHKHRHVHAKCIHRHVHRHQDGKRHIHKHVHRPCVHIHRHIHRA